MRAEIGGDTRWDTRWDMRGGGSAISAIRRKDREVGAKLHLAIDGYGADGAKLRDTDLVYRFLDEYPSVIGMTKIAPPQVYEYHGQTPQDWGVSGIVLIAESHISVHTFPDRGYVNIDIFSCKDFDAAGSLGDVKRMFGLPEARVWTLERGVEYATPREAHNGMVRERVGIAGAAAGATGSAESTGGS